MKRLVGILAALFMTSAVWAQTGMSLPAGTALKVKLENTLTTFSNKEGDPFSGRVTEAVMLEGKTGSNRRVRSRTRDQDLANRGASPGSPQSAFSLKPWCFRTANGTC